MGLADNKLYYGDNLHILRNYIARESVDLVYLDPPFNSNQNYNVLFKEEDGTSSAAQVQAFTDTWQWNDTSEQALDDLRENAPEKLIDLIEGFLTYLKRNSFTAYIVMMTPRLLALHRVLKPTGSIYLHCDPAASHYLKIIMDQIFDVKNFRNEIIWKRSHPHGNISRSYGAIHDVLLFYAKSNFFIWNEPHRPYLLPNGKLDPELAESVLEQYHLVEEGTARRFQATSLLNPNPDRPNLTYEFHGYTKVWRWTKERMMQTEQEGKLYFPKDGKGIPREKRYLDEQEGLPLQDIWEDITLIGAKSAERLGYPTQKPEALLERIIKASSNEGDIVLDPFCGCGTTIVSAEKLKRKWLGIDITHLAIALMKSRLADSFTYSVQYEVVGEPVDLHGAYALKDQDRYQFQWWALSLVQARPIDGKKKGADGGIDGVKYININPAGKTQAIKVIV
jgi:site-specific DNA-methyltransferase (adenine-specific)